MFDPKELKRKCDTLGDLLKAKIGTGGKSLETRLNRAGRRLPKRLHEDGRTILAAQSKAPHPKLARTIDETRVDQAFSNMTNHLRSIDPKDRRKGQLLGWLGSQVFNLLLIVVFLIAILWWRGFIG